jgi:hypothetical protein
MIFNQSEAPEGGFNDPVDISKISPTTPRHSFSRAVREPNSSECEILCFFIIYNF